MADKTDFLSHITLENGELSLSEVKQETTPLDRFLRKPKPCVRIQDKNWQDRGSVAEKIWEILYFPGIRKGPDDNLSAEDIGDYQTLIKASVERGEPVGLVFIGFPFKTPNPLKTNRKLPDAGEFFFVKRLLEINEAVKLVYPPGISWEVLAEGEAYRSLFGVTKEEAWAYLSRVRSFISYFGAEEIIGIQDLAGLCHRYPEFLCKCEQIYKEIMDSLRGNGMVPNRLFQSIFQTMRSSANLARYSPEEIYYLAQSSKLSSMPEGLESQWNLLEQEAIDATARYLAFNQAKNKVGLNGLSAIQEAFPKHCYVSITQKPGRYSFHPLGRQNLYFPHHGVPVVEGKRNQGVKIVNLMDIVLNPKEYRAMHIVDDVENKPFAYATMPSLSEIYQEEWTRATMLWG